MWREMPPMKRILLIEDEKNLVRFIQLELEHEAFAVKAAIRRENGSRTSPSRRLGSDSSGCYAA